MERSRHLHMRGRWVCTIIQGFGAYGRGEKSIIMKKTDTSLASGPQILSEEEQGCYPTGKPRIH